MRLSKNQFFTITLMLFAMFFGAGNFIFPPMLGKEATSNLAIAISYFCLSAVVLPILGVYAVAKNGNLENLVHRVNKKFALFFTTLLYLIIGPLFAIPRAGATPFEVISLPFDRGISMLIYSIVYFSINCYICLNPSKIINAIGTYLTPVMLLLIFVLFFGALFSNSGEIVSPSKDYLLHPSSSGFLQGYQTMDALASLVFAIVIINSIKLLGITEKRIILSSTIKAGILAGILLAGIYLMLSFIGYKFSYIEASNGASFLSIITYKIFGNFGKILLGIIFLLACLTTTIGLVTSTSEYFAKFKLNYKFLVILFNVISLIITNIGLKDILNIGTPILATIYPLAIVLIILSLINNFIEGSKLIYSSLIYTSFIFSLIRTLDINGINLGFITKFSASFAFYDISLGWVIPTLIAFLISYILHMIIKKRDF